MRPSNNTIYPIERIISALTYLTYGLVGFIWIVIAALLKKTIRPFLMYHILQSVFLSLALYLFKVLYNLIYIAFAKIPVINLILFTVNSILYNPLSLFYGLSFLQLLISGLWLYLIITSFMGLYSYIPWVSNIIKGTVNK